MSFLSPHQAALALEQPVTVPIRLLAPQASSALCVDWDMFASPLGKVLVAVSEGHICWLGFADKGVAYLNERFLHEWGKAKLKQDHLPLMDKAVQLAAPAVPLLLVGTPFQQQVWLKLLAIPHGALVRYGDIARALQRPRAARAVGNAVGSNPVSWLVPCHRVGHSDGGLSGFGWGAACKARLLALENIHNSI